MTKVHPTAVSSHLARVNLPDDFDGSVEIVLRGHILRLTVEHSAEQAPRDANAKDEQFLVAAKASEPPVCRKVPRYDSKGRQIGFITVCSHLAFEPLTP